MAIWNGFSIIGKLTLAVAVAGTFVLILSVALKVLQSGSNASPGDVLKDFSGSPDSWEDWVDLRTERVQKAFQSDSYYDAVFKTIDSVRASDQSFGEAVAWGQRYYVTLGSDLAEQGLIYSDSRSYEKGSPHWKWEFYLPHDPQYAHFNMAGNEISCSSEYLTRCMLPISSPNDNTVLWVEYSGFERKRVRNGFYLVDEDYFIDWENKDSLIVSVLDSSTGGSSVKRWLRGQEFEEAEVLHKSSAIRMTGLSIKGKNSNYIFISEYLGFFERKYYSYINGVLTSLKILSNFRFYSGDDKNFFFIVDGGNGAADNSSCLAAVSKELIASGGQGQYRYLYCSPNDASILNVNVSQSGALLTLYSSGVYEIIRLSRTEDDSSYNTSQVRSSNNRLSIKSLAWHTGHAIVEEEGFLTPKNWVSLDASGYRISTIQGKHTLPNSSEYSISYNQSISDDGEKIPYYLVHRADLDLKKPSPAIMQAYGGFKLIAEPVYSEELIKHWLDEGGIFVLAGVRGGGERGNRWHLSATKLHKKRSFDDFEAIARDLISQKLTKPEMLGARGESNGGLLVGAVMTRKPELFGAMVIQSGLLDMERFVEMGGGAWISEYGDPQDPSHLDYLKSYSPVHNVYKGVEYPSVLLVAAEDDDVVDVGHSRLMVQVLEEVGADVYYWESKTGGHDNKIYNAWAVSESTIYSFFRQKLFKHAAR
ncbi:prolyl oligopeptidase family serine peptidase [uncultured Pseudoteredinibacter sp.]|uniref:prolyl oligopeptidase family serine peptidase n=1 Tax=uncultured Pseudoteredinibacter sp. TaxID=1641701 RepID=UPI002632CBD7|nr:prolyl oligopeptidase family serine peptidase [uncultured Pseudoteredinibacter sp.]